MLLLQVGRFSCTQMDFFQYCIRQPQVLTAHVGLAFFQLKEK